MKPLRVAPVVILLLVTAGCDTPEPMDAAAPAPPGPTGTLPSPAAPDEPPPEVPRVLRFSAPQLGGGTIEGRELAGRDVALWFWAPW